MGGENMRPYETMFIINPELDDEATDKLISAAKDTIEDNGGEIAEVDQWGTKELAYEIEGHRGGYYTVINFSGQPETVEELERIYQVNDTVLRYIILRDDE
jgi:small subunit ribosomal protein S6